MKKKIGPHHFVSELLNITYYNSSANFTNSILILIFFLQLASYAYKLNFQEINDEKTQFFFEFLFYSNISNILIYFSSEKVTYFIFGFCVVLVHFLILYPICTTFLKKFLKVNENSIFVVYFFNKLYQKLFQIFPWILLIPILEISVNLMECEKFSYIPENKFSLTCDIPTFIWFFSPWVCLLCFIINGIYLWIYSDDLFLNLDNLRMDVNAYSIMSFLIKYIFVLSFGFIYDQLHLLIYVFLLAISLVLFLEYYNNFPIRNQKINKEYISILVAFTFFIIIMIIWDYMNIIPKHDLLYINAIFLLLGYKLGGKIHDYKYFIIVKNNFIEPAYCTFLLEEMIFLQKNKNIFPNILILKGIFQYHVKQCKNPLCKLRSKHMKNFETFTEDAKMKVINDFINYTYVKNIEECRKNNSNSSFFLEKFILKFVSFLTNFNTNSVKAYYEIAKILSKQNKISYYFFCVKKVILKNIRNNIMDREKEKKLNFDNTANLNEEKEINIAVFVKILKEKKQLEELSNKILKSKITFWEKYKDGLQSSEEATNLIREISKETIKFDKYVKDSMAANSKSRNLFFYKYSSFISCILFNNISNAVKLEEEVESTRKREYNQEKDILTYMSFFDNCFVPLKVSFIAKRGFILEESKSKRLANFFGFGEEELKQLSLYDLMPDIISEHHDTFFDWYLNKPIIKSANVKKFVDSYARNKDGLIFPVQILKGYAFEQKDDFVLHGIIKLVDASDSKEKSLLFDQKGEITGINQEIFAIFNKAFPLITPSDINLLNIYSLVPSLFEILEKNSIFTQKSELIIRNQYGSFIIPKNLMDIIDVLKSKQKEISRFTKELSYFSSKTGKTKKSEKTLKTISSNNNRSMAATNNQAHAQFLTKLYNTQAISLDKRSLLEEKYKNNTLTNKDIIDEMIDLKNIEKLRVSFDLKVHVYHYGHKPKHNLILIYFTIKKARTIEQGIHTTDITNNKMTTSFVFDSSSRQPKDDDPFKELPGSSKISDVPTNFVQMPPENIPDFGQMSSNSERNLSDLNINFPLISLEESKRNEQLSANAISGGDRNINIIPTPSQNSYDVAESPIRTLEVKYLTTNQNLLTTSPHNNQNNNDNNSGNHPGETKNNLTALKEESKLSQDINYSNSSKSNPNANKRLEDLKGVSSDKFLADIENNSKSVTSLKELNKTYSIFNSIAKIQKNKPKEILYFLASYFFELIYILIYCIVIYRFSVQYISNYYDPLHAGLENFSLFSTSLTTTTLTTIELELHTRKLITINNKSLEEMIFYEILDDSFINGLHSINYERNNPSVFKYQQYMKQATLKMTDPHTYTTKEMNFMDFLDLAIQYIGDYINTPLNEQNAEQLFFFTLNFQYFTEICDEVILKIKEEFVSTNQSTTQSIVALLIIFSIFCLICKIFQIIKISQFYNSIQRLLNIFLRVNEKSALNELFFLKKLQENYFQNHEDIIYLNFPEKTLNKKTFDVVSQQDLSINLKKSSLNASYNIKTKIKKASNQTKKTSFHNIRPISLNKPKLFILLSFSLIFFYLFFIYLYWSLINAKIESLINVNNYFNLLYTMPSLVQGMNLLLLREKISFNEKLENSGEPTQSYANRLSFFSSEIKKDLDILNQMAGEFPGYLFDAAKNINNDDLNILIGSDLCKYLFDAGIFFQIERDRCNILLDGAFTHGIISSLNRILQSVKDHQYMADSNNYNNNSILQTQQILLFMSQDSENIVITEHFFEEASKKFFNFISLYYNSQIENEINNMELVIILTTVAIFFLILLTMHFSWKKFNVIYQEMSVSLSLIPYERLINDEQTAFLIKKFIC